MTEEESEDIDVQELAATSTGSSDRIGREEMVASYLPEESDWDAKTVMEIGDPGAVAALRQFHQMFPEVEGLQPVIDEFLDDYLRSRTSVGGQSRKEYKDILQAMMGGTPEDNSTGKALAKAFGVEEDD